MTTLHFLEGCYQTNPVDVGWLARAFPSLYFHRQFISICVKAGLQAQWSEYNDQAWVRSSQAVLRALESVGIQIEITGMDQFQNAEGPFVFVGNHISSLETMVLPGVIQPFCNVTFVVKASLLEYPIFKHIMRSRDPIAVSQTNPRQDLKAMLDGGVERLNRGISLVIFPEGERAISFDPKRFNTIGIKLAQRTGVSIVPVALQTDAWERGRVMSDFGKINPARKVRFAFGSPLRVEGRGKAEHQAVLDFIGQKLAAWDEFDQAD